MNKSTLAMAMVLVGSFAMGGCKANSDSSGAAKGDVAMAGETAAVAPEENPDSAPVEDAKNPGVEKDSRYFHYYAPHSPPAMRREVWGRAPSANHFWAPGYYRWNGREHVWYDGRWIARRPGYEYASPRWVTVGPRYEYLPGHWVRR